MTIQTPTPAVTAGSGVGSIVLTDAEVVGRLLADDSDMTVLLGVLRDKHLMDGGGPLFEAFTRLSGTLEMAAIEIRHIGNLLRGAS